MAKVVVITGASAGIGAALAKHLASKDYQLVLVARREKELREVAEQLSPTKTAVVVADVTRRSEVEAARDAGLQRFGHIDVWVNNVGRGIAKQTIDLTDDDIDEMIRINVKSALYGMQAIFPHFKERNQGHIINVSSFLGRVPVATIRSAYSAAKAALNSLTANARIDIARTHPSIMVSLVLPGLVSTEFAENALHAGQTSGPPLTPTTPPQTPEVVAETIADLITRPRPEVYTNPLLSQFAKNYYDTIEEQDIASRSASR